MRNKKVKQQKSTRTSNKLRYESFKNHVQLLSIIRSFRVKRIDKKSDFVLSCKQIDHLQVLKILITSSGVKSTKFEMVQSNFGN